MISMHFGIYDMNRVLLGGKSCKPPFLGRLQLHSLKVGLYSMVLKSSEVAEAWEHRDGMLFIVYMYYNCMRMQMSLQSHKFT